MTEIDIQLLPATIEVIQSTKPTTLFIGGRGCSKSYSGGLWIVLKNINEPGFVWGACAPTHSQASSVILPNITQHLDTMGIRWVYNKQPNFRKSHFTRHDGILSMDIPGSKYASQIFIGSAEKYDFWRGREFAGLWADEIRDFRDEALKVILACLRGFGDKKRIFPKLYTTTPNGFDSIYKEYMEDERDDVCVIRSRSQDNVFLPDSFFEELKNNYSQKFYQQEVEGLIINFAVGQVVYAFDHDKHTVDDDYEFEGDWFLSCDFNLLPMCWTYGKYTSNKVYVMGEIRLADVARTQDAIEIFHKRVKKLPKQIYISGDASGKARSTKSNKTDYDIIFEYLKQNGCKPINKVLSSNPSHINRANVFNKCLEDDIIVFNTSCKYLFEDFYKAVWKEGTKEIDKSKSKDPHMLDSISYFIYRIFARNGVKVRGNVTLGR